MTKKTVHEVWRSLNPIRERKMSEVSLNNLITEKPKWQNLPTKAIRVPQVFADKLLEFARIWDRGESLIHDIDYTNKDVEQAISILKKSLKLPANKGGAIKKEIHQAIKILKNTESEEEH